ncbi:unnamed protein product [Symbiodinium sp. CCMP2592]|nr:unnamed protein product [Symbiodinium sp. CCMP2592]
MQRADILGSALDPLLPLQRWIQYTQGELQSLRADCRHQFEQITSTERIQQSQLDSLQSQIRELAQQQAQFSAEMTEIANTVTDLCNKIQETQTTLRGLVQEVLTHFSTQQQSALPATQLAITQPDVP